MFAHDATGVLINMIDHPVCNEHLLIGPRSDGTVTSWDTWSIHWAFHVGCPWYGRLCGAFSPYFRSAISDQMVIPFQADDVDH